MPAGTFTLFESVSEFIGDGSIDLDNDAFKIALLLSTYTLDLTDTVFSDLSSHEHAAANGYPAGGQALDNVTWTRAAGVSKFDSDDEEFTAAGGSIVARWGVIYDTTQSNRLLGIYLLDDAPANVTATDGNKLKVGPHATNGWFRSTVNP